MYDALGNIEGGVDGDVKQDGEASKQSTGLYEVPDDLYNKKLPLDSNNYDINNTSSAGSAVLPPSSVVHRSSPQVQLRQVALNPTSVDTDKDTQNLVEEDKEC
jgi:low density lipoprotein-related protein 2